MSIIYITPSFITIEAIPNELKYLFMYKFMFPRRKLRLIIQGEQF